MGIIVMGIDPGSEKSAYIQWTGKEILDKGILDNEDLLDRLEYPHWEGDITLAIESMNHITKGGKSIVHTLLWAGQFYHAWHGNKESVERYKVTLALTKKMPSKESDKLVREALIRRFGKGHGLRSHLWQAWGLAVVHWDHLEFEARELE